MTLAAGQSLSFYEIVSPLGAGGMGEVYRARDTRLDREVAIKVLPEAMASDEDRLRRFEREAKTLASLNHPNVAGIYGVDQVDDLCFLALELVPGEDLATRLSRGPLPVEEAIDVCRQIAEGLEAAHEAGVVHRDLKPANVRITPEGKVKVLDFGLAKPILPKTHADGTSTAESDSFLLTEEGLVLGTPTYMSPEQARGKPVDRRTDIWAFGCVLFECLTGKRVFGGDSLTDVLAAIVGEEPDWGALPAAGGASLRRLLQRCLRKDPRTRLRDVGEARVVLEEGEVDTPTGSVAPDRSRARVLVVATTAVVVAFAIGWAAGRSATSPVADDTGRGTETETRTRRFLLAPDFDEDGKRVIQGSPSLSPDARFLALRRRDGIAVRALNSHETTWIPIEGDAVFNLVWSPDSEFLAYHTFDSIWRVPRTGGTPNRLHTYGEKHDRGLAWLDDGRIAFMDGDDSLGVRTIPERGGPVTDAVILEQDAEGSPVGHFHGIGALPGGRFVALLHLPDNAATRGGDEWSLVTEKDGRLHTLLEIDSEAEILMDPTWVPGGFLLYRVGRGAELWAVRFSLDDLAVSGDPFLVGTGIRELSFSRDGTSIQIHRYGERSRQWAWWSQDGGFEGFSREHSEFLRDPSVDEGSESMLYLVGDELWRYSFERDLSHRIEVNLEGIRDPFTLPDGRIVFTADSTDEAEEDGVTYRLAASGVGEPEQWLSGSLLAVGPNSHYGILRKNDALHLVDLESDEELRPFRSRSSGDYLQFGSISPDGEWGLYVAGPDPSKSQLYLTRFPSGEGDWQVSVDGAIRGRFSSDGKEILIESIGGLRRVSFTSSPEVRLGKPEPVEPPEDNRLHPIQEPGGDRFLTVNWPGIADMDLVLVLDWVAELESR